VIGLRHGVTHPKFRAWIMNTCSFTFMTLTYLHGMVLCTEAHSDDWNDTSGSYDQMQSIRFDDCSRSLTTPKYDSACIRFTTGDHSNTCGLGCACEPSLCQMKRYNFVAHKHSTTSGWLLCCRAWPWEVKNIFI
jgi:hypothetical protein